jgi:hypothetical protein
MRDPAPPDLPPAPITTPMAEFAVSWCVRIPPSRANWACALLLLGAGLIFAAQGLFENGALRDVQDHVITHSFSRRVAEGHEYFRDFTYPLPAVIFKLLLGLPGMAASSVVWTLCSLGAFVALIAGMVKLLGRGSEERALLAPTLACCVWVWCVQWDLRAVNVNLAFAMLALWGLIRAGEGRGVSAGALLAASVALKLYAAPLVLYLAWRGWWRAFAWTGVFGVALFVVAPVLYFGAGDAWLLTGLWLRNVVGAMQPGFVVELIAYKVSVEWVLLSLLTDGGEGGAGLYLGLRALQLALLGWLVGNLWRASRQESRASPGERLLVDAGLVLSTMVVLSPMAEPHHGVVALLPATVLAHVALDADRGQAARITAAAVLALIALGLEVAPSGAWKGAAFIGGLLAMIVSLPVVERLSAPNSSRLIGSAKA